ncbi:hypothetical protein HPB50_018765 [Hyalomma asiaticum]|uniref:Uncharacterized protein n=1 Tax=Hyalomma asiaticum TaxID=266040 RepID=A0ACB7S4Q1_HYAAI|nr:hypothetical protein HPB50_018765 [Hyalomma asiaticum]
MSRLLGVRSVHNVHDTERLRTLYDELQTGVRSLVAQSVASSTYSALLLRVIRKSIPSELCLHYYWQRRTTEVVLADELQDFLNFLQTEAETRERAQWAVPPVPAPLSSRHHPQK